MATSLSSLRRNIVRSAVLPTPRFRYSPVVEAGPFVFISGLVGLDPFSGSLAAGGAYGQTKQIISNFMALCQEQNWEIADLLVARVYCGAGVDAASVNMAWDEAFVDADPPARTFVVVTALPLGATVEIEFQLLRDEKTRSTPELS
ncbi:RidA family protein [Burkholderia sp. R-69608]|uniref:RidA family protein n=1 Tax=Paraburkholderia nemoris TaxID=2793076 RepID=UPI0019121D2B|nr:RidA family protein [Paraburkholderia nemoris]MBK5151372.1 RidA family protein [Burkholderia sp. R-69608]